MKTKRALHKNQIADHRLRMEQKLETVYDTGATVEKPLPPSTSEDIRDTFKDVVLPKKRKIDDLYKRKVKKLKDEGHFIPYVPSDKHTEEGYM